MILHLEPLALCYFTACSNQSSHSRDRHGAAAPPLPRQSLLSLQECGLFQALRGLLFAFHPVSVGDLRGYLV